MSGLLRLYQRLVPFGVRGHLYEARDLVRVLATDPIGRRERFARWQVSAGRPVQRVRVPHGRLTVDLRDVGVGRRIYVHGQYEPDEAAVLSDVLQTGMTYLDIGGNIGYLATHAGRRVGPSGLVVAVEPEPYNFGLLTRNLAANPFARYEPVNAAAGDRPGVARLFKAPANLGDHRLYADDQSAARDAVEVPVVRLDALFAQKGWPPPDVVKLDIQGYEPFAAAGLDGLVARGRPMTVLTEYWPIGMRQAGGDPAAYLGWFRDRGFACHRIAPGGRLVPADPAAVDDHLPPLNPAHPDAQMLNLVFRR